MEFAIYENGNTHLTYACEKNDLKMVKKLFNDENLYIDVNEQDGNDLSPLMWSCIKGNLNINKYIFIDNFSYSCKIIDILNK